MPDDLKPVLARQMEVYAGFLEHTDHHVGRLIDTLEDLGVLDDTLVYYIIGDNGASAEGTLNGTLQRDVRSSTARPRSRRPSSWRHASTSSARPTAYNHYAVGWAHAMDTPYQWTKQVASHWGGTRNGTIVHWPNGIEAQGEIAHAVPPRDRRRADRARSRRASRSRRSSTASSRCRCEGVSMPYTLRRRRRRRAPRDAVLRDVLQPRHLPQGLDRGDPAQHAVGHGRRRCRRSTTTSGSSTTRTPTGRQAHDLAAEHPDKLAELQRLWLIEAAKYNVLPLDDRARRALQLRPRRPPDARQGQLADALRRHGPPDRELA